METFSSIKTDQILTYKSGITVCILRKQQSKESACITVHDNTATAPTALMDQNYAKFSTLSYIKGSVANKINTLAQYQIHKCV